jgi:hypothetical protein
MVWREMMKRVMARVLIPAVVFVQALLTVPTPAAAQMVTYVYMCLDETTSEPEPVDTFIPSWDLAIDLVMTWIVRVGGVSGFKPTGFSTRPR